MRILSASGQKVCQATTTQSGESSPAVGTLVPNQNPVIVAGSSDYFPGASDTNKVFAWNPSCRQLWTLTLDGIPMAGPALADTMGNGQLQILEGTNVGNANTSGSVYDISPTGQVLWTVPANGAVLGSIATVDPDDQGYQDLLVPTTHGVMVLDGKTGAQLATLDHTRRLPELTAGDHRPQRVDRDHRGRLQRRQPGSGEPFRDPRALRCNRVSGGCE